MRKQAIDAAFWRIVEIEELRAERHRLWVGSVAGSAIEIAFTRSGLWALVGWGTGASVAFRVAASPPALRDGPLQGLLSVTECSVEGDAVVVELDTALGAQTSVIQTALEDHVMSFRTTLSPKRPIEFEGWSRDIVPLGAGAVSGFVHTCTRDLRSGFVHASVTGPGSGSFLYVQQLPTLAPFFEATRASAIRCVGGVWPDIGFAPPRGRWPLRPSEQPTALTHAHIAWSNDVPTESGAAMEQGLELAAAIYLEVDRAAHGSTSEADRHGSRGQRGR